MPKRPARCPHCDADCTAATVEEHMNSICPRVEVVCGQGCGASVLRGQLPHHLAEDCPRTAVPCPLPGCEAKVPRAELEGHMRDAAAHLVAISRAMVPQSDLLAATQRITSLEDQLAASQGRAARLERQLVDMNAAWAKETTERQAALERRLEPFAGALERLSSLESRLAELRGAPDRAAPIERQLVQLVERVAPLESRLPVVDQAVTRLGAVEQRLAQLANAPPAALLPQQQSLATAQSDHPPTAQDPSAIPAPPPSGSPVAADPPSCSLSARRAPCRLLFSSRFKAPSVQVHEEGTLATLGTVRREDGNSPHVFLSDRLLKQGCHDVTLYIKSKSPCGEHFIGVMCTDAAKSYCGLYDHAGLMGPGSPMDVRGIRFREGDRVSMRVDVPKGEVSFQINGGEDCRLTCDLIKEGVFPLVTLRTWFCQAVREFCKLPPPPTRPALKQHELAQPAPSWIPPGLVFCPSPAMSFLGELLGPEVREMIRTSRVLVVGAGGIGCELLKDLLLTGFENIEIIDLDTIDVSNLNRQFLFRREHVGMSKSEVARKSALKFNPRAKIVAHHGNIRNPEMNVEFFSQFVMVMNALDNVDARRHVNRMCLAARVPLIESGTRGVVGQVAPIIKGLTECYECNPITAPKQYAVCTIRDKPTAPIHCIVWAKMLFGRFFGPFDDSPSNYLADKNTAASLEHVDKWAQGDFATPETLHVHAADILRRVRAQPRPPSPVRPAPSAQPRPSSPVRPALSAQPRPPSPCFATRELGGAKGLPLPEEAVPRLAQPVPLGVDDDHATWTLHQNAAVFADSVVELARAIHAGSRATAPFDKDDVLAVSFVTAASNLRAWAFGIPVQTRYQVKAIAGNIVPAIAATNAVAGGLVVIEAIKVMQAKVAAAGDAGRQAALMQGRLRRCYISEPRGSQSLVIPDAVLPPNPECVVCSARPAARVCCDFEGMTVGLLMEQVLRGRLALNPASLIRDDFVIYDAGEDVDMSGVLPRSLAQLRLPSGCIITAEDDQQNLSVELTLVHAPGLEGFEICGVAAPQQAGTPLPSPSPAATPAPLGPSPSPPPTGSPAGPIEALLPGQPKSGAPGTKHPRDGASSPQGAPKKGRPDPAADDEIL
ncbi:putative SUMO-activating enzyme subunit uba-2 [Paratrimastix pyriformis]|uniref:SUMO-activating enzyme subunit uba-2 n=1 Tax=Paratrimastix pyriformis TaxID=342808 RepID=A0ABQ8UUE8_9EUKA|nr:putative SUMO-activating enzyme subunit uba-2 [Paratrimastix pyriformis]